MEEFLQTWGTLGVFLTILATGLGLPVPEELPIVVGGALVGANKASAWLMLPTCIVGVIIGDSFLYLIGRFWGAKLLERPFVRKRLLPPERLEKISANFKQHGIKILLFARLTPGIRAPIFLFAGISKLPLVRFMLADGIYAIPGVTFLWFLGWLFADSITSIVDVIENDIAKVKGIIFIIMVLAVAGYFTYKFLRKPMVTGDPKEMPPLVEKVEQATEKGLDMASKMIMLSDGKHSPKTAEAAPDENKAQKL